jgi:hypothetical protein
MKKMILIFSLMLMTTLIFGQADSTVIAPQDPTNDWADWVARILAAIGILVPGYDAFMAKARARAAKAQELFTEFSNMVNNNQFDPNSLRSLASRGRDVVKKD